MLTLNQLCIGLKMDKGYLSKVIKKLKVKHGRIRGKTNHWEYTFNNQAISKILKYREGIAHDLKQNESGDYIIEASV